MNTEHQCKHLEYGEELNCSEGGGSFYETREVCQQQWPTTHRTRFPPTVLSERLSAKTEEDPSRRLSQVTSFLHHTRVTATL